MKYKVRWFYSKGAFLVIVWILHVMVARTSVTMKYKVRWFYSKGAFLVIVWILLVMVASTSVYKLLYLYVSVCGINAATVFPKWTKSIAFVMGSFGAVFSGWLADAKFGNYKVMKYSVFLLFILTMCSSIYTLFPCGLQNIYVNIVFYCIYICVGLLAGVAFLATSFQLGLDQMPDASSASITSFIAWFMFCITLTFWIVTYLVHAEIYCSDVMSSSTVWFHLLACL